MQTGFSIKIIESDNYKKTKLYFYQNLISKQMYLVYNIRLDMTFVVKQLDKHNSDPKKDYLQAATRVVQYLERIM